MKARFVEHKIKCMKIDELIRNQSKQKQRPIVARQIGKSSQIGL
jgi:hypothetical protein